MTFEHSHEGVTQAVQVEDITNARWELACCVILAEEEQAPQCGYSGVSKGQTSGGKGVVKTLAFTLSEKESYF